MIKLLKYNYKIYNIFREEATLALAKLMIKLLKYNYKIYNIFREEATLALASCWSSILVKLVLRCQFLWRKENLRT